MFLSALKKECSIRYKAVEVVRIGTRAVISKDGKPLLATHWDGYPASLGKELLQCDKTMAAVIVVAKRHTIDAAHRSILEDLSRERVKQLAGKHRLTETEIKEGKRRGNVICAEDYGISDIDHYGDWADFQYDIRGEEIYFRPLNGSWPESVEHASEFKLLTGADCD